MTSDELVRLRRRVYRHFADTGQPPQLEPEESEALSASHAAAVDASGGIVFANPFAAGQTEFEVAAGARRYQAICIWDALGIVAALEVDGVVRTRCPCCATPLVVNAREGELVHPEGVVHFLVPAREWYDDLVFT